MKNLALMMIRDSGLLFWATVYVMLGNPVCSVINARTQLLISDS